MSPLKSSIPVARQCNHCNTQFIGYRTAKFCSTACSKTNNDNRVRLRKIERSRKEYPDTADSTTYVECKVCGYRSPDIGSHVLIHGMSSSEYLTQFGGEVVSFAKRNLFVGDKNPAFNHGGKYSPFSKKFINYKGDDQIEELKKKCAQTKIDNNSNSLSVLYYTERGYTESQAKEIISERQRTFSLQKCIDKYGVEEGTRVWSERQAKWSKSFKKNNFSKISQELFTTIMESYVGNVYYATYDRPEMNSYGNKEYRMTLSNGKSILPDFIDLDKKKIIEFDGDYWHSTRTANPSKEKLRDQGILDSGYEVLHIKEYEYKKDKNLVVQQCIDFLNK